VAGSDRTVDSRATENSPSVASFARLSSLSEQFLLHTSEQDSKWIWNKLVLRGQSSRKMEVLMSVFYMSWQICAKKREHPLKSP